MRGCLGNMLLLTVDIRSTMARISQHIADVRYHGGLVSAVCSISLAGSLLLQLLLPPAAGRCPLQQILDELDVFVHAVAEGERAWDSVVDVILVTNAEPLRVSFLTAAVIFQVQV